jgi:DNA-binding MarR family transcriptional regulator
VVRFAQEETPVNEQPHCRPGDPLTAELAHELGRHARLLHALKSTLAALVPAGLDVAAFPLLLTLVRCGPRRQGELAELSFLDPSTVSRHVAQLARAGYVQRRPDPEDGRAVQLVATREGERVADDIGRHRQAVIAAALAHWSPADVRTLVALMGRLNDDLEAFRPHVGRGLDDPPARVAGQAPAAARPDPSTPDQENP